MAGASQFSPDGVRVARFVITGENWLDPSTLRLAFKLKNTSATQTLQLVSGPWCLFDQVRLLIGGVGHLLMPNAWNIESTNEDGLRWEPNTYPQVQPKIIGPGQYLSLNLTPLQAILNAQKYLPIRYMGGMQLEFTLCNADEALHPLSASRTYQI